MNPIITQIESNYLSDVAGGTGTSGQLAQAKAQSIMAVGRNIRAVSLSLYKSGTPADSFVVRLTSSLGGAAMGQAQIESSTIATFSRVLFDFGSAIAVSPGQTYYLEFHRSGARDDTNKMSLFFQDTNPYGGGYMHVRHNNVWQTDTLDGDTAMVVYEEANGFFQLF